ncbi:MAG: protease inhibitor I42 family protein [Proteobacteria bacterium]|nr:protease inhibitor I42 family protein [Pseudomonadota bacterium]
MKKQLFSRCAQAFVWCFLWLITMNARSEEIKYADPNEIIVVTAAHREVAIRLPANPSTGYLWMLHSYDKSLMETPVSEYIPGRTDKIGAPGVSIWRFKFKARAFQSLHKTTVILQYQRPWEQTVVKKQRVHFILRRGSDVDLSR